MHSSPWYLAETVVVYSQRCVKKLLAFNSPFLNVSCFLALMSALTEAASIVMPSGGPRVLDDSAGCAVTVTELSLRAFIEALIKLDSASPSCCTVISRPIVRKQTATENTNALSGFG